MEDEESSYRDDTSDEKRNYNNSKFDDASLPMDDDEESSFMDNSSVPMDDDAGYDSKTDNDSKKLTDKMKAGVPLNCK